MALEDSNARGGGGGGGGGNTKIESISGTCEGHDSIGERSVSESDGHSIGID